MNDWKARLDHLFPPVRKAFVLEAEAAVGASPYWHTGVATGVVLPIRSVRRQGHLLWQTPYEVTGGGRIDRYELAEEGEITVYPETKEEGDAYLVALDPAPGLAERFAEISDAALTGLLAHELAEITLVRGTNYHHRITHHGLPETQVDWIAADRGYRREMGAYLEFLLGHSDAIRQRLRKQSVLELLGTNLNPVVEPPPELVTRAVKDELVLRLTALGFNGPHIDPQIAGYLQQGKEL